MVDSGPAYERGLPFSGSFWDDLPDVARELHRVRDVVVREAASAGGSVGHALEHYVSRPGKLLRPAFVIIGAWSGPAARARGGRAASAPNAPLPERIIEIAAAVETLHLATLIHDDIIDGASTRRGEPALHTLFGARRAVLMGDYLLSRCFTMISGRTSRESAQHLAAAAGHLVRGEIGQLDRHQTPPFSRRGYLRRVTGKTALLFVLSLVTGAREMKAPARDQAALARTGYAVGTAFQIIDDVLDLEADATVLGKPVATDLRAGLYTLPIIEAVEADPGVREVVMPPPASDRQVRDALSAIRASGGLDRAREVAASYTGRARRALATVGEPRVRDTLSVVIERLLGRDY